MAGRIAGITIEIGGDTKGLQSSLKSLDGQLQRTQSALKDVNKLLKLDPGNTELLRQKQKQLQEAITSTKERLQQLKAASEQAARTAGNYDAWKAKNDQLQAEIDETAKSLQKLKKQAEKANEAFASGKISKEQYDKIQQEVAETANKLKTLKQAQKDCADEFGHPISPEAYDALQREIIATEQDLKKLEKEYKSFGSVSAQQIKAAGEKMASFGNKVSAAGRALMPLSRTAAAIGAGLLGLGYKALTTSDDLATLSQQTGLTTDEIQGMQYASELVDVSFESMNGALKKMKKTMTGQEETWQQLGISVTNADGSMRSATDVFYESLTALSQIENETERDQLAMQLFGKSADELAGIIDDGGESLKKYSQQAKDLGLVMDEETITAMNSLNDTVDELKANFGASLIQLGASLATALAPALTTISEKIKSITEKIRNLTPEQSAMILKITGIVAAIAPLLLIGGKLITGIGMLLTFAPAVTAALGALSLKMLLIPAIIAGVVAGVIWMIKNWDKVKAKAIELKDNVVAAWQNLKASTLEAWEALKSDISAAWDNIKAGAVSKANAIKSSVVSTFNSLKATVSSIFNSIKSTASSVWNSIKSTISNAINSAKNAVQTAINAIKNAFNFSWSLPKLRVPKVTVTGGEAPYGIGGKGSLPHFNVTWEKKAYENPVMFTSPTVLATPNGYYGFGDGNGAEIVMGLNKLRELVGTAGGVVINVYPSQGMDVNQLADQIQDRFVQLQKQRSLAYA